MERKRFSAVLFAIAGVLALGFSAWFEAGRVPQLVSPVRVVDAAALADGGTVWVAVVDAKDVWYGFGLRGGLEVARESLPVVVRRWETLPFFREFAPDDARVPQIARIARQAAMDNSKYSGYALFAEQLARDLESRHGKGS